MEILGANSLETHPHATLPLPKGKGSLFLIQLRFHKQLFQRWDVEDSNTET